MSVCTSSSYFVMPRVAGCQDPRNPAGAGTSRPLLAGVRAGTKPGLVFNWVSTIIRRPHMVGRLRSGTATISEMIMVTSAQTAICKDFDFDVREKSLATLYRIIVNRDVPTIPTVLS